MFPGTWSSNLNTAKGGGHVAVFWFRTFALYHECYSRVHVNHSVSLYHLIRFQVSPLSHHTPLRRTSKGVLDRSGTYEDKLQGMRKARKLLKGISKLSIHNNKKMCRASIVNVI
jgi:hypothetical protein